MKIDLDFNSLINRLNFREQMLFFITIMVALTVLPYMLLYRPTWLKSEAMKVEIKNKEIQVKQKEDLAKVLKLKAQVNQEREKRKRYLRDFSELLGFIGQEARKQKIELLYIKPKELSTTEGGSKEENLAELMMRGTYNSFYNFFKDITSSHYLIGFQSLQIINNIKDYPGLTAQAVVMAVYVKK
jgi:Tfp pilus assembly protein PilO